MPCTIAGHLRADGRTWAFEINAAATATWRSDDRERRFGCDRAACESLVLLMPDGLSD